MSSKVPSYGRLPGCVVISHRRRLSFRTLAHVLVFKNFILLFWSLEQEPTLVFFVGSPLSFAEKKLKGVFSFLSRETFFFFSGWLSYWSYFLSPTPSLVMGNFKYTQKRKGCPPKFCVESPSLNSYPSFHICPLCAFHSSQIILNKSWTSYNFSTAISEWISKMQPSFPTHNYSIVIWIIQILNWIHRILPTPLAFLRKAEWRIVSVGNGQADTGESEQWLLGLRRPFLWFSLFWARFCLDRVRWVLLRCKYGCVNMQ